MLLGGTTPHIKVLTRLGPERGRTRTSANSPRSRLPHASPPLRRDFRRALSLMPGLDPNEWTPRELRHSFVSLLSDAGVPIEQISQLVRSQRHSVTDSSTGTSSNR